MGYVTLGVVTLVVYLMLFAVYSAKKIGFSDNIDYCQTQIKKAMKNHKIVCRDSELFIQNHYQTLMQMDRVYVLGCGSNYGTALEGALKIGETVKILAVGYEQDEFLHGPALQLSPHYTVFLIDNGDHTKDHAKQVFNGLLKVTPNTYMITPENINHHNVLHIENSCDEPFTCLYYLPFFELIAEVISTDLDSKKSHPLYFEMNKIIDFRTPEFRETHAADED
jgi:glucoselysine-6-phosphate deglycase